MRNNESLRDVIMRKSIPVPHCGCWLWTHSELPSGYGETGITGAPRRAHRASYEAFVGPIPSGAAVCHRCDTPSCVNPDHLFLGTHQQNMRDCVSKKRHASFSPSTRYAKGHRHGMARLTPDDVMAVIDSRKSGASYRSIAQKMGISSTHAHQICARKAWSSLVVEED